MTKPKTHSRGATRKRYDLRASSGYLRRKNSGPNGRNTPNAQPALILMAAIKRRIRDTNAQTMARPRKMNETMPVFRAVRVPEVSLRERRVPSRTGVTAGRALHLSVGG